MACFHWEKGCRQKTRTPISIPPTVPESPDQGPSYRSLSQKNWVPGKLSLLRWGVTHHRLVLVLPPGQDASRSSVEWNACHRPKSSAVPTVRLPFPPSLVRFFHRERRKPARPTYREEEAPSINKSVSHRWWTRTDVPRMSLVSRTTSFMTRSVTKL